MIDKKKTSEKKVMDSNYASNSSGVSQGKQKASRKGTVKVSGEKEIKLEEEVFAEENLKGNVQSTVSSTKSGQGSVGTTGVSKVKKVDVNLGSLSSTPKSGIKYSMGEKTISNKGNVNSFSSNMSNLKSTVKSGTNSASANTDSKRSGNSSNTHSSNTNISSVNQKTSVKNEKGINASSNVKKKENSSQNWPQNPNAGGIVEKLENYITNDIKERISSSFSKLCSLNKNEFFKKLHKVKKEMNSLFNINEENFNEYHHFLLRYIEGSINQINGKLNNFQNPGPSPMAKNNDSSLRYNLDVSTLSDDGLINYIYYKNNSVSFEIPIVKRDRAMSANDDDKYEGKESSNNLHYKFINRNRLSSEEIERRMRRKLNNAEKKKEVIKMQHQENISKLMMKISSIKQRRKREKQQNLQKLAEKLEKYNRRHQQFLLEKASKAKIQQDKVAEINFLHRMDKENRDLSIIKKLNISIERRDNYLSQKLNKTIERNMKEEAVEKKRKIAEDELRNKVFSKMEKNQKKGNEEKIKIDNKIELVNKRKSQIEDRIEFLRQMYSEHFIWQLLEADYFDVDDLVNLTNITKFEIVKSKLKKDKEIIDKMFERKDKSRLSNKTRTETQVSNDGDFFSSNYRICDDDFAYIDDSDTDSVKCEAKKRSKSFTIFDENDFLEIDYLFKDTSGIKKKRKKKKKGEKIKDKIISSINSMSQSDLNVFYSKINKDKKMKKFLIKHKNGKYIKSKLIVRSDEIINKSEVEGKISNSDNKINNNNPNLNSNKNTSVSEVNIIPGNTAISSQDKEEVENSDKDISSIEEKKEKFIKGIVQNSDFLKNDTILINSESLSNILEKNSITLKWCKLCNMILPNDQDTSSHISKAEHKKLKTEYGISLQDDSSFIMVFQSLPGDISEDLKNERINAIKVRLKKVKQKLLLKAVKHENFWSYKQDFPSNNKQRLQKISFDIEKQTLPNIKDYESLESNLKDLIKILEQKKQNDLHIMRQLKAIHCLVEILKKPAVCHKSEIKSLGKIIDLVVKVLMYFSTMIENRNYMVVTNRISVVADLLLWVLNKPSKIPLGISFLPDTIYLITIHIKHRIPFEYLSMKDDFIEYMFLSNILVKFRQKYISLVGPIDLTSGFGSLPLVLLKSLGMIEALTSQININYCSKPVYVKNSKMNENILFVLEYTELVGIIQLLTTMLLSNGPVKPRNDKDQFKSVVIPQTVISATILGVKVLNNIARLDLSMFQNVCNNSLLQEQLYHLLSYIINYSLEYSDTSDDLKELLHETILMMNYISLLNEKFQNTFTRGEVTLIQRICALPFSYFCEKKLKDILFPTIISISYKNERNVEILNKEINLEMLIMFLKEKIQLEPIIEEEEVDKLDESKEEISLNLIKMGKGEGLLNNIGGIAQNNDNVISGLKKRTMSFSSTASSTKSCHDMLTGVSDYIPLYHRFPRNLWEKALDFYISNTK